jgi:hypothetical protein
MTDGREHGEGIERSPEGQTGGTGGRRGTGRGIP